MAVQRSSCAQVVLQLILCWVTISWRAPLDDIGDVGILLTVSSSTHTHLISVVSIYMMHQHRCQCPVHQKPDLLIAALAVFEQLYIVLPYVHLLRVIARDKVVPSMDEAASMTCSGPLQRGSCPIALQTCRQRAFPGDPLPRPEPLQQPETQPVQHPSSSALSLLSLFKQDGERGEGEGERETSNTVVVGIRTINFAFKFPR